MLTPLDIESKTFSKGISGYNIQEVRHFITEIVENYEKLYKENIELKDKINILNETVSYYKNIEETLRNTMLLAEKTSEEARALARKTADQIEREAKLKATAMLNDARNEIYKIHKKREELIKHYDASKIQIQQYLRAQLEMTEKNVLEIENSTTSIDILFDRFDNNILSKEEIASHNTEEQSSESIRNSPERSVIDTEREIPSKYIYKEPESI